jgi:hypothetical protein
MRGYLEADVTEHLAASPVAGQAIGSKFHHGCQPVRATGQYPEKPNIFRIFGGNLSEYGVGREKTL